MKRLLLIIGAILFGLAARAQSVTYTCRYWFDQNHAQAVTTTFGENGWEAELDVGQLTEGLHALHFHVLAADTVSVLNIENDSLYYVMDTAIKKWSAPQSFLFLKISDTPAAGELAYHYWFDQNHATMQSGNVGNEHLLLDVDQLESGLHSLHLMLKGTEYTAAQSYLFLKTDVMEQGSDSYVYHCWFDQDFAHEQTDVLGTGHLLLDVNDLEEGIHTVNVMLEGTQLTATQCYLFMKVASSQMDTIDMSHLAYHCWFDQDFEHQQTDSIGDGHILLDVNDLEDGLHTVHVMMESSTLSATMSYMFMKMPVEDPTTELQYICWFDQDYNSAQTGLLGNGIFELEVGDLPNGIHTVNVQLDNGSRTAPQTYLFYKQPLGGFGIARWEYWLNDDFENRNTTLFTTSIDTLDIISLLPVGHPALRSSCFHFHPNGDEPFINAKNEISFRVWDAETRFLDMTRFFIDEQVQQDIVAEVFERNTTETIAAPRNNQIHWFKMDVAIGDSLAFRANKACTMQLFAPSGEEVYARTASEAMVFGGCHAWENGTYYLAVHDVTGSGETVSITYNWLYRYAILTYDVHVVGNGGCSTITFQGNGFNSLLNVYLVNNQNDTIRWLDIGHESNTTIPVMFNFNGTNLGIYDAVFEFYDETMRINGAIEVEEVRDIVLSLSESHPPIFLRGSTSPVRYSFTITNTGNMTAYAVPIYVYIASPRFDNITHIDFDGLNLPFILDYFDVNWDSVGMVENVVNLRKRSKEMGDDHNFYRQSVPNDNGGNYKSVRSNYFFVDLAPNETKTMRLKLTPNRTFESGTMSVWMTVPNQIIPPYLPNGSGSSGGSGGSSGSGSSGNPYCCVYEQIQCTVDVICDGIDLFDLGSDVSECVCGVLSNGNDFISGIVCEGENPNDAWKDMNKKSVIGTTLSCIKTINPFTKLEMILNIADALMDLWDLKDWLDNPNQPDWGTQVEDCITKWQNRKPDCPSGDSKGGSTIPFRSIDPNDIHGYLSESGSHYIRQEIQNVQYEIEFENDTTLATAAAHTIIVRDTLDATKFDLNSLAAYSVTIGDKRLELDGEQNFARTLDMRPELYVIAQVEQDYDPTTGIVEWTIQSLDPMTMEPTDDPNQGVLPVNYYGNGVGFIDYSINLLQAFDDGTEISNRAGIIFDQEDIIMTPAWTNIVDAVKPTSHIENVFPVADSLNFSFVSSDSRSGVWYHTLYYRNDSTEMEWQVKKAQIFENSLMLHLEDLQTTEYLVMAVDSAGNREEKEMVAEYIFNSDDFDYSIFTTAGNWSTASNWQGGVLPAADDVVFIEAPCQLDQNATVAALNVSNGQSLTLQSGNTLTVTGNLTNTEAANLVIEDGAQLVNTSENIAATVKKDVTAYGSGNPNAWHTIASPVSGMSIAGSGFVTPEYDLYRYNETNLTSEEWENYKANLVDFTTFEKGRGYLFANSNSFSPVFIGTLNNTDVTCSLTYTNRPNDPLSGFNLIGNPFPHNIYKGAGAAIDNANLASGYYTLTNEGTWQAHTFEDAILPGQGVLVKATAPTVLTIAKSNGAASSESSEAKRCKGSLSISVAGDNGQDQAYVYFGQGIGLDKVKSIAKDALSLAVRDGKGDFAIAHCDKKSDAVELVFTTPTDGSFTLTVDVAGTDFKYLHLIDQLTGDDIDLLALRQAQGPASYTFEAKTIDNANRFKLVFEIK